MQELTPETITQLLFENAALRAEVTALRALSFEDALTGLKNRRYFDERLREEAARATRRGDPLSVVVCDVDDFKRVNDTFGHVEGDRVLRWLGGFFRDALREHDIVCRLGGDEFAVILPATDQDGCRRVIARLQARLRSQLSPTGRGVVSLSLGAATWEPGVESLATVVARADKDMYRDKSGRKGDSRAA